MDEDMSARNYPVQINMTAEEYASFRHHLDRRVPSLSQTTFCLIAVFEKIERDNIVTAHGADVLPLRKPAAGQ